MGGRLALDDHCERALVVGEQSVLGKGCAAAMVGLVTVEAEDGGGIRRDSLEDG